MQKAFDGAGLFILFLPASCKKDREIVHRMQVAGAKARTGAWARARTLRQVHREKANAPVQSHPLGIERRPIRFRG